MKTKSRRLYDIANVLASIGVITRIGGGDTSSQSSGAQKHRGSFMWVYEIAPIDLPKCWTMKKSKESSSLLSDKNDAKISSGDATIKKESDEVITTSNTEESASPKENHKKNSSSISLTARSFHPKKARRNVANLFSPVSKKKRKHKATSHLSGGIFEN